MSDDFHTTRWSVVLAAQQEGDQQTSSVALETLCETYWYPLYVYVRRRCQNAEDARDITQSFFADLLRRDLIGTADPDRGRFRAYLLTACKRYMINESDKANAVKRGGQVCTLSLDFERAEARFPEPVAADEAPEKEFERQWAQALLDTSMSRLRAEYTARDRITEFEELKAVLAGDRRSYADVAEQLGQSPGAVKVAVYRMKKRFRDLMRDEVAATVESTEEVEEELRRLWLALG